MKGSLQLNAITAQRPYQPRQNIQHVGFGLERITKTSAKLLIKDHCQTTETKSCYREPRSSKSFVVLSI